MTPDKMLQTVVEAAGECWHEFKGPIKHSCKNAIVCGCHDPRTPNPSPNDLNELFRLAEKLGMYAGNWKLIDDEYYVLLHCKDGKRQDFWCGATLADALLRALYYAVKKAAR